jgi:tripartite-type tricarboxylate transporter receptor subunit TctC
MNIHRRRLIAATALCGTVGLPAFAQGYPTKAIRVIVPYTPGSGPDVLARTLTQTMAPHLGQVFVVDNRPGANGNIGIDALAKAPADGYTIGLVVNSFSMNPGLYKQLTYDAVKDFEPLGLVARGSMVFVTKPTLGAKDLAAFLALAKSKPDTITYSTPGNGSPQHLATALMESLSGTKMVHVPYKGAAGASVAILAGEVDSGFLPVHTASPYLKDGRLKALAVSTKRRSSLLPNVVTAEEAGLKGLDVDLWYAMLVPTGTPKEATARLRDELQKALKDPQVASVFNGQGLEPTYLPPAEFSELLRNDMARWSDVIKRAHITID